MKTHYAHLIASTIRALVNGYPLPIDAEGMAVDQFQSNGAYGAKQLRVRLPGHEQPYRVIIAPADAPVTIGGVPADQHFSETLGARETA
jgi:hypothetical protein